MPKVRLVSKALRALSWPLALIAMSVASFLGTQWFLSPPQEAEAQAPPPQTSREERRRLAEEDATRPKFGGELNGFTFYLPRSGFDIRNVAPQRSPKCTGTNARYVGEDQATRSRVNFSAGYLPPDVKQTSTSFLACEDDVFNVQRNYSKKGVLITALHEFGPALTMSKTPIERMQSTTIGGKPALIIRGVFPEQGTEIQMRDNSSHWILSGRGISMDELIKVAEGLK